MTEYEKLEKAYLEELPRLSEAWYKGEFDLGYYNFALFRPIEQIIEICENEYKFEVTQSEIEDMCNLDLLEFIANKKDSKTMFPLFIPDRIKFIKELQAKFNYPLPRLQQIIAYENRILSYSDKACEYYYADRKDIFTWFIKRLKFELEGRTLLSKSFKTLKEKYAQDTKKTKRKQFAEGLLLLSNETNKVFEEKIAYLTAKRWSGLSDQEKKDLKETVFDIQLEDELERILTIRHYYNKILSGYSPQVEFKEDQIAEKDLSFDKIDWDETFLCTETFVKHIDFFRTPYFLMEVREKEIDIKILDVEKVDASTMRQVERIYIVFRSRLGGKRKGWGEASGRKALIESRNDKLRALHTSLRREKPKVAGIRLFEELEEYSKKLGMPVHSLETLKRIIYSKKNMS